MCSLQKYGVPAVFALLCAIFFSCHRKNDDINVLGESRFHAVLVDAFLAEAYTQEAASIRGFNAATVMNQRIYPYIFEKHQIDSAAFSRTFDYYLHRPDEFRELLTRVNDTLNARLKDAPVGENPLPPLPPAPDAINSDTVLAKDAMDRYRLFEKIKQGQAANDKKSN